MKRQEPSVETLVSKNPSWDVFYEFHNRGEGINHENPKLIHYASFLKY